MRAREVCGEEGRGGQEGPGSTVRTIWIFLKAHSPPEEASKVVHHPTQQEAQLSLGAWLSS